MLDAGPSLGPTVFEVSLTLGYESKEGATKHRIRCRVAQGSSAAAAHQSKANEREPGPNKGARLAKAARAMASASPVAGTRPSKGDEPPRPGSQTHSLVRTRRRERPSREGNRIRSALSGMSRGSESRLRLGGSISHPRNKHKFGRFPARSGRLRPKHAELQPSVARRRFQFDVGQIRPTPGARDPITEARSSPSTALR